MKHIWYYIRDHGDGSVSVALCNSEEEAIKADDAQEAWAESSVGSIDVDLFPCEEDPGYEIRFKKYTDGGMHWVKAIDGI